MEAAQPFCQPALDLYERTRATGAAPARHPHQLVRAAGPAIPNRAAGHWDERKHEPQHDGEQRHHGIRAAPRLLSHTSDLGKHTEPGSFVAAAVEAVLRVRHAVTDMAPSDTSPATAGEAEPET